MKNKINSIAEYPTLREYQAKQFMNIATAVGIGVSAAVFSMELEGKDEEVKNPETEKTSKNAVNEQIILLVSNLGHKDFKEREKATNALINLGKDLIQKKDTESANLLKNELEKTKKSKDPEVKERAKKILLAITPPPPQIPNGKLAGDVDTVGDIAF